MGYFDRLQKRARYYDADLGEYRWGALCYTGSREAGVDYVNSNGLCVVYGTNVHYSAGETGLYELSVATNFVNPRSSGDPSSARCYLYFSDPTMGGDASVSAPPPGFWAVSQTQQFEAGTAGSYLSFSFSGLGGKPSQLWFWFECEAAYADFGSDQIYHYATGNYNSSLNTGTRSPAIYGGFVGGADSGGGGGEAGARYTLVDSGTYSGIFAATTYKCTGPALTVSRSRLSFAGGGQVLFDVECGESSGTANLSFYLCDSPGFDLYSGQPTGNILAWDRDSAYWAYFFADVKAGQDYYLFAVLERSLYTENEMKIKVEPQSWSYTLSNKGTRLAMAQSSVTLSMSMGNFQTGRMEISFDYNAQIELSVAQPPAGSFCHIWLSEQADIDSSTGQPISSILSMQGGGTGLFNVEKGRHYYLFAMYNGGSSSGSVSASFIPPPVLWYQGDYGECSMLEGEYVHTASLASSRFSRVKMSFAHTGTARIWTENSRVAQPGQRIEAFFCESDCIDVSQGYPNTFLEHAYGGSWDESADLAFYAEVVAGCSYWLYIKNTLQAEGYDTSVAFTLHAEAPVEEMEGFFLLDRPFLGEIYQNHHDSLSSGRITINCWELRYRYSGQAEVSVMADTDYSTSAIRCYIAAEKGVDSLTGIPTGEILASSGPGAQHDLSFQAQAEKSYYLYLVCPEIFGSTMVNMEMDFTSPPPVYFSITDRAEYHLISGPMEHFSAPGMSGVCLLELSFASDGYVSVKSQGREGTGSGLCAWLSDTPYLDGLNGEPFGTVYASSDGSAESGEITLGFYMKAYESRYLFVRADSVYASVSFTLSVTQSGGGHIVLGGRPEAVRIWIYTAGRWRQARPFCHAGGKWNTTQ